MKTQLAFAAVMAVLLGGCSKSPGDQLFNAGTAVTSKLFAGLVEKDAMREANALIAKLKTGPECDVYRRRLTEAGKGPPADGATQHAITWTYKEAGDAGCVAGP